MGVTKFRTSRGCHACEFPRDAVRVDERDLAAQDEEHVRAHLAEDHDVLLFEARGVLEPRHLSICMEL